MNWGWSRLALLSGSFDTHSVVGLPGCWESTQLQQWGKVRPSSDTPLVQSQQGRQPGAEDQPGPFGRLPQPFSLLAR